MPALRVAVDLTALAQRVDRPWAESLQVRFTEALIQQAPAVSFAVLTRPHTGAALAHLEAANARRLTLAEPSPVRSVLARFQGRLLRRVRRSRFANRLAGLQSRRLPPRPLGEGGGEGSPEPGRFSPLRRGGLARLGVDVDVVFCPFTTAGVTESTVPLVVAIDDLLHVSHPYLLGSRERSARAQASSGGFRRATTIVCSTPALRDVALQCDGVRAERVLTIAPGRLLAQPATSAPDTAATLARHGLVEHQFLLLVADFEPRHNHRVVLTALAMFRARCPESDIRLVCVGGPDAGITSFKTIAAQMGLGQYVQFPGPLGRAETSALLHGSRAVLVPALYETVGETVLEAMQCGRPVLCGQIPGLAELTGGAALTFDPHRPADLATAFERADGDPALLERLAQLGRARAATLDDAHAVADAYVGVLRGAVTTCPPSR